MWNRTLREEFRVQVLERVRDTIKGGNYFTSKDTQDLELKDTEEFQPYRKVNHKKGCVKR